jgi:hypothetical protein
MRLTAEREQTIREKVGQMTNWGYEIELLCEIDYLRKESAKQWLQLTELSEQNGFLEEKNKELKEVLSNLLRVSRECADDYEYGEEGYYYWVEQARELLK